RVLLWASFAVCMGVGAVGVLVAGFTVDQSAVGWQHRLLAVAALNLAANYCLWFSFFPPAFYRRWIARDAAAEVA
ncbi:MAG: hypothetical protein MJE66_11355, partial [Proteobacteria bacterium]|nr:hypothetical protein [Pseudomonadota bacterium]